MPRRRLPRASTSIFRNHPTARFALRMYEMAGFTLYNQDDVRGEW